MRVHSMSGVKNKGDKKMVPKDQTDSLVNDEGSFDGSSVGIVLKKGPWTSAEDAILLDYVNNHGEGNWNAVQKHTGLSRCGKSCRLRWANHLRPNLKKGALTPEEEQLIVQLHAKMGNKWAQMATFLPGRTDNEIKNYWNTRVKRRQRAVLPLYPQNVSLQASNENQTSLTTNEYNIGDKRSSIVVQGDVYDTMDTGFDPLKANPVPLSYSLPFPDISFTSMLSPGLGSRHFILNRGVNRAKRFKESQSYFPGNHGSITTGLGMLEQFPTEPSEKIHQNIGLHYSYVPNLNSKNLVSFGCSIPGSHAQSNGNFSPSEPLIGTVKVELPSLQYPETDYCNWLTFPSASSYEAVDTYIQSPPVADSMQSDCASPRSSGLLEALVQESHTISSGKKQSSERSSSCSATNHSNILENSAVRLCSAVWEEASDPNSPFCRSAVSLFNEYTPTSNSPLDELLISKAPSGSEMTQPSAEQVSTPNVVEKDFSHLSDFLRPDALLGSDWQGGACQSTNETSSMNDAIAALLGEDSSNGKDLPGGTSSMLSQDTYQQSNRSAKCLNVMKFA